MNMRILFTFSFLAISIAAYCQSPYINYVLKDSASGALLDSVKVTFTSYCHRGWIMGKVKTNSETRMVSQNFRKRRQRRCEASMEFEKEGYTVCRNPYKQLSEGEWAIYMKKVPSVRLRPVD